MSLTTISNGDTGLSVRNKLNTLIAESNSIVNVVDYGADPTAATDSTTAIQNAINDAFGPYTSPIGQGAYAQRVLFFPNGEYQISSPLYIVGVDGGMIIGNTVRLLWYPTTAQNVLQPAGDTSFFGATITPCIMLLGWKNGYIHGINIDGQSTFGQTDARSCGFYLAQDATHGTSTANIWENCGIAQVGGSGIIAGVVGNCDNGCLINVTFDTCNFAGINLCSQNSINWCSYNGGASHCASSSTYQVYNGGAQTAGNAAAAYRCTGGQISLFNPSMSGNAVDLYNGGANGCIIAGSTEPGSGGASISSIVSLQPVYLAGFACRPDSSFAGPFIDCSYGGLVTAYNCSFEGTTSGATIANLYSNGTLILDLLSGSSSSNGTKILGNGNAEVYLRNVQWQDTLSSFTGRVMEYKPAYSLGGTNQLTVSTLPTASSSWNQVTLYPTDNTAAWSAGAVGNALTGGGSHTVPAICPNGSSWVMGA